VNWAVVPAPIGPVAIGVGEDGVREVRLAAAGIAARGASPLLDAAAGQLADYFAGHRTGFDLPLSIPDDRGSDFERAVWAELRRIPYGQMRTYGEVAASVGGDAGAARAVGAACNRNPVPLIVPCHRVVGAGGKLVGFGGGLPRKRWLLEHEARVTMERAWS
jgi:methylated-DNA-[protein]-cysteine S-methyltransferase